MPSSAARRRAATLVLAIVLHGARALGQDPYGASPGEPGFGGRPPPGAPRQRQPSTRPSDAPETHAASGANDRLVTPGGEPTLPDDPLAIPAEVAEQLGTDKTLDEPSLGRSEALRRRFYGVLYEESNEVGYRFRSSFPPFWFERIQPSLKDPTTPDRASLFGLYYNRRSAERADDVLFPLFWNLRDLDSRTTVIGPFAQRVAPDRSDLWLAPLFFTGSRPQGGYTIIPPLLTYFNHDAEGGFNLIGPYFCSFSGGPSCGSDSTNDVDLGIAPLYFAGEDEFSEYRLIPPLLHYHSVDKRELSSVDLWGPVYRKHTEERDALHVFPLYYSLWGKDERHTTLFPFFHVGHKGSASLIINPLFAYSNTELGYETIITWGYARYRGKTELDMITPLFWHYRDPEIGLDQKLILPFYFGRTGPRENSQVFFPFYANFERKGLSESTWITPLFRHATDLRGWSTNIHPLFYFGRDGYDTHTVIAPFFWDFASRSSRTTIGFPIYWRFARDNHMSQLIGNVYYSEQRVRQGLDWEVHVFPFFSYGETPDGHWWNVLYGLAGYERRGSMTKLRTFWVPIPLSE